MYESFKLFFFTEVDKKGYVTKDIESNDVNFENDPRSYRMTRGSMMGKPGVLAGKYISYLNQNCLRNMDDK